MNFLQRIFQSRSGNHQQPVVNGPDPSLEEVEVNRDLFVDGNPPSASEGNDLLSGVDLHAFFGRDFSGRGYREGYALHSGEILEQKIREIKSDFRMEVDKLIDQKRQQASSLESQCQDMKGLSARLASQIGSVMKNHAEVIDKLEKEKELSAEDEGWVMKAVHSYKSGYMEGIEQYYAEMKFGGITGMFK